jgi:hypothetical protein
MTSPRITPDMTLLDVVQLSPATEKVFRSHDAQAGECLLCNALFDTVAATAQRYGFDLEILLKDLEQAAKAASNE